MRLDRREFAAGLAAATMSGAATPFSAQAAPAYRGSNVIIVRFGGGVRRGETIAPGTTFAPFLLNVLARRGVLIPSMTIAQLEGVDTSHAEGTLNILTGRYRAYRDAGSSGLAQHLEPTEPTVFEYLRRAFDVPIHQALLINGEDRPQEEFFSYGVHKSHGIAYRSEVLSLYRFKLWKLRTRLSQGDAARRSSPPRARSCRTSSGATIAVPAPDRRRRSKRCGSVGRITTATTD